ncbi:MAG: cell division protein FtsA [Candidatus Yonathbacteria bacterium RIFCSPLOWO2_01_FULL_47_33b]|uniref:Cell division protein FtsA n=1 Tax=Candidatus Yonathbacteria bacterium RIFCSPLOWO2_01_FULL_47_33b TaxID=1802727 RepID=A0A1G2SFA2_9BACT|nr:MAG: cell division protein FtsA [Candidatus Yonathbacteria bacterium RIFCSPLOWO2_01_FULL_47_33b]
MRAPIKRISTGIDVGTHTTRIVIIEHTRGEAPRIIGTGVAETRGLRHGYIVNKMDALKSVSQAIAHAEKMAGIKITNALLSVGGISLESVVSHGSATISRASGEVGDQDIKKAASEAEESLAHLTNKRIIHRIPLRYKLDGKEVLGDPKGMIGSKLEVKMLVITCLEQHLNDIVRVIEELGVEVDDIIPSPIAAGQVALNKKQRSVGCALVNIGAETVSIAVFENDIPISLQVFPIGSTDITNDIALGLKIPLDEAEKVKISGPSGTYSKKKLDEIIEARLEDIFELIEAHLKKINRNGLLPAGIVLTGGGAGIATIEDLAKAVLKLPSSIAHPAGATASKNPIKDSSWLVAYGLALYGLQKPEAPTTSNIDDVLTMLKKWIKPFLP